MMHFRKSLSSRRSWFDCGVLCLAVAGLSSCGRGERTIAESRILPERERKVQLDATSEERFGMARPAPEGGDAPAANPFRWDRPEGWEEVAATSMRVANFRFGDGGDGECYLTALPGSGGGAAANINRWRGQMGLGPWNEEDIASLPAVTLLGQAAPFAAMDGTYTGMGGEPRENYRMLGAILSYDQFTLFVKMTGPADVVKKEEDNFKAFCASLRIESPGNRAE